jgi:alpha-tubulin suppressor-like RCC1 family protein
VQVLTDPAAPLTGLQAIAAGDNHTCALKESDGSVWCWGGGVLGNGEDGESAVAVRVIDTSGDPILGVTRIFSQRGVSGAFYGGRWYSWGNHFTNGQGSDTEALRAAAMYDDRDYISIGIGQSEGCGVDPAGDLWCWPNGETNTHTQVPVVEANARAVGVGYAHRCILKTTDVVACFGLEYGNGALGDGEGTSSDTPIDVLDAVQQMVGSLDHTCALRDDGSVWCWGLNSNGQIGDGSDVTAIVPVKVLPAQP